MYYKLVLLDNESGGILDQWNMELPATVGRGEDCSVRLNDPSVSRQHCRFSLNAYDALVIQDLGSTNGVYVRDERVKQSALTVGEVFQIGGMQVRIEMLDAPLPSRDTQATSDSLYETRRVDIYEIP